MPLKGAIVGYGFISRNGHAPAYLSRRDQFEIVAIADICAARRAVAQRELPKARIYPDIGSLLAAEAHRLDFVDVCTPPCDHAAIARAALACGLHVLCEKPLCTSTDEARSMLSAALQARRVLYPSHNYKHAPVVRAVRRILDAGRIGKVRLLTLDTFRPTHARGVPEWNPDWRRERRYSGGGIAMDHGSHTFYLAFDWLGSYPSAITAKMAHQGAFDTEDSFSCTVSFPTGVAVAHLTWTAGVRKVIYTIHGERGAVRIEDDDIELTMLPRVGGPAPVEKVSIPSNWMDASHVTWFGSLFDQFARAIASGEHVSKETLEASLCVQLVETAYASARQGCRELPLLGAPAIAVKAA